VTAIQFAISALGGGSALAQISDCTVLGTFPSNDGTANFTWQTEGNDFNYSSQTSSTTRTLVSGHGNPADITNENVLPIGAYTIRADLPYHIPGLVLYNELQNNSYSIIYIGQEQQNGVNVVHVQTVDQSDLLGSNLTPQDWYLDSNNYLPVSVSYRIPDEIDSSSYANGSMSFNAFTQVNNVLVPFGLSTSVVGNTRAITISSFVFNTGIPPSTFDVPGGH
jgi:hypothetical protein